MTVYQWTKNQRRCIPTAPGQGEIERDYYPLPPLPNNNKDILPGSFHRAMSYPAGGGYPPTQLIDYDDLEEFSGEQTMKGAMFLNSMPVAPDQSNFTSTMVVEPTALGRAILDGTSPPICGPEYAGPYPRTNSVPFKGMFMRSTANEGNRRSASVGTDSVRGVLSTLGELRDYINAELSGASPTQRQALIRTLRRAITLQQEVRAAEGTSAERITLLRAKEESAALWESTRDLVQAILAGFDDVPGSEAVVTPDLAPTVAPPSAPLGDTHPTHSAEAALIASKFQNAWGMLEAYMIQQEDAGLEPWKTDMMTTGQQIGQRLQEVGQPPTMPEADYAQQLEASLREIGYDDAQIALYFSFIAGMRELSVATLGQDLPLADAVGSLGGAVMMGSYEDVNTYFAAMTPEMLAYWDGWVDNLEAYLSGTMVVLEDEVPPAEEDEAPSAEEEGGGIPTGLILGGVAAALAAFAFMR